MIFGADLDLARSPDVTGGRFHVSFARFHQPDAPRDALVIGLKVGGNANEILGLPTSLGARRTFALDTSCRTAKDRAINKKRGRSAR